MKNAIVVVVEGVDNAGKTTLSKRIAEELGFFYLYTPQPPLASVRKEVELLRSYRTRFFYYLASVIAVQDMMEEKLANGTSIVIDRYIYSTFIMHEHLGVDVSCVDMMRLPIRFPNVGILLTVDTDIREERRERRGEFIKHDTPIEQLTSVLDKAQVGYRSFTELHEIDTSLLTMEQVFNAAVSLINKKGECNA
jgi:thymidylate kinase